MIGLIFFHSDARKRKSKASKEPIRDAVVNGSSLTLPLVGEEAHVENRCSGMNRNIDPKPRTILLEKSSSSSLLVLTDYCRTRETGQ
jgi:hypothetical protein